MRDVGKRDATWSELKRQAPSPFEGDAATGWSKARETRQIREPGPCVTRRALTVTVGSTERVLTVRHLGDVSESLGDVSERLGDVSERPGDVSEHLSDVSGVPCQP